MSDLDQTIFPADASRRSMKDDSETGVQKSGGKGGDLFVVDNSDSGWTGLRYLQVAGVIGQRKFAYDLWGDTVNLASRLETQAKPGGILVSENVALCLDGQFAFGPPQVLELKGKGPTPARFLLGRHSG